MQLTGKRLSDPAISTSTTLADLYNHLVVKPKPKKLVQTKEIHKLKVNNPNVTVHRTRQTPIHKERAVGRWKVIEEELVKRDLPVIGTRFRDAKVEWR
jgi:hypothetical protein